MNTLCATHSGAIGVDENGTWLELDLAKANDQGTIRLWSDEARMLAAVLTRTADELDQKRRDLQRLEVLQRREGEA